jgi:ketosteroid isomerase-like protein
MTTLTSRAAFEAYLTAFTERDFAALDALVHPDFEDVSPQSGERVRGAANLKAIIENYPEGGPKERGRPRVEGAEDRWVTTPTFTVLRIEGTGNVFTAVQRAQYPDGSEWHVIVICEMRDGKAWHMQTYFAPSFEPPAWRAQWVDVDSTSSSS